MLPSYVEPVLEAHTIPYQDFRFQTVKQLSIRRRQILRDPCTQLSTRSPLHGGGVVLRKKKLKVSRKHGSPMKAPEPSVTERPP